MNASDDGTDQSRWHRVDAQRHQFEAEWRSGCRPAIESYLKHAADEDRPTLLQELIAQEVLLLEQCGGNPTRSEYRTDSRMTRRWWTQPSTSATRQIARSGSPV